MMGCVLLLELWVDVFERWRADVNLRLLLSKHLVNLITAQRSAATAQSSGIVSDSQTCLTCLSQPS
jgi:hypothetical protein